MRIRAGVAVIVAVVMTACNAKKGPPPPPPPLAVKVVTLAPQSVSITTDLPGRTVPYRVSDIRPQVNGVYFEAHVRRGR